ncbi:MAG: hypothetical protein AB1744_12880, partial [Candidatus Zixiibacteriota bacterium]
VIALVTVAAICVAVFSPPAAAVCPDPDKPPPWMMTMRETPQGDDGGWDVPVEKTSRDNKLFLKWTSWSFFEYVNGWLYLTVIRMINPEGENGNPPDRQDAGPDRPSHPE